jgi:hypothetical protein
MGGRTPNQLTIKANISFVSPFDNNRKKSAKVAHNLGLLISNKSNRSKPTRLAKTKVERMNNILLFYLFSLIYVK